jgi:predicted metal-dependent phosphoesterase TrpH
LGYNQNRAIDLHIHSTASDGTYSPAEILSLARTSRLDAISITDHDTIDGSKSLLSVGKNSDLDVISGVEISSNPPEPFSISGSLHILGYGIDLNHPQLNRSLKVLQAARKNRNPEIINRLNQLGFQISMADIIKESNATQLGRPHIAQHMLSKGFVGSINEAFDSYLGKGKPAYVDKYRMDWTEAIKLIAAAGGVSVLAHPFLISLQPEQTIEDLIRYLKPVGLNGIEVYYPAHSPDTTNHYIDIAKRYDLLITGGTDFHGTIKPEINLGTGKGDFFVPYTIYERIIEFLSVTQPSNE